MKLFPPSWISYTLNLKVRINYWSGTSISRNAHSLGDGLYYLSDGTVSVYWDQYSLAVCKIRGFVYFLSEGFAQWLMVFLLAERLFALIYVFKAKSWLKAVHARRVIIGVLTLSLCFTWPALISYDIYPSIAYQNGKACLPRIHNHIIVLLHVFLASCGIWLYPTTIILILTFLLGGKLILISKSRKDLYATPNIHNRRRSTGFLSKEINSAITIVLLSILEELIIILTGIVWIPYFLQILFPSLKSSESLLMKTIGRFLSSVSILVRFWNLYVYSIRIPAFRQVLLSPLCSPRAAQSSQGRRIEIEVRLESRGGNRSETWSPSSTNNLSPACQFLFSMFQISIPILFRLSTLILSGSNVDSRIFASTKALLKFINWISPNFFFSLPGHFRVIIKIIMEINYWTKNNVAWGK